MASVPKIETSEYFFRIGRNAAKNMVNTKRSPIIRPSSVPGKYAVSYYNIDGKLIHSLFDVRVSPRNGLEKITIGDGIEQMEFSSPRDFIEYTRRFNPSAYEEDPVIIENNQVRGGLRRRRRASRRASRTRNNL